ncbi:Hypp4272 [Branchiostoma lanceolatum]|uniref:Hypp4272 protein n=1 Tax=Branchiostoma lanceolatum TaxID=7740 RepID=A0A8K0EXD5_BRALA|nr:Hypp4272 [Branchiostoma lanceolatum]
MLPGQSQLHRINERCDRRSSERAAIAPQQKITKDKELHSINVRVGNVGSSPDPEVDRSPDPQVGRSPEPQVSRSSEPQVDRSFDPQVDRSDPQVDRSPDMIELGGTPCGTVLCWVPPTL